MTAVDDKRHGSDDERVAIRALVPGVADEDLPFGGRRRVGDRLMRELGGGARAAAPARRWFRRPAGLVVGAAACAVALGVAASLLVSGGGGRVAPVTPPEPAAVRLLDRVAVAAQRAPEPVVRDGQFLYTRTEGFAAVLSEVSEDGRMESSRSDQSLERWESVDGSARTLERYPGGGQDTFDAGKGTLVDPTYRFLESLPTDPEHLLQMFYEDAELNHGAGTDSTLGADQGTFVAIGDLLNGVECPPRVSAALYRAAARIPGVVLVPEATDALGRKGVAVAREHDGERTEWIFDRESLRLLGYRTVVLKDGDWGKAGEAVESKAIIARGVSDRAGEVPRKRS
ncbi:CU044_5270 family protein [Streptomyces alkaliterrae]|uniref:CU044_5270 family protein n=2 Tax=Streptomyces alkaliterrae TaxID=2213162 RepID=A0A7W3ZR69_9ACTN|nr:CU044_5270 family protein [Streptomyces alkaliterrae]MBB1257411.1 CU044_5270 family protein [Streptomyces alkaliterrae]